MFAPSGRRPSSLPDYCHENGESAHEKSMTYEQLAIFMLRGAPKAHDACCKQARKRTSWVLFSWASPEIKCERNRPTSFVQQPVLEPWIVYIHSRQVLLQE
jgi:hypothetical protein